MPSPSLFDQIVLAIDPERGARRIQYRLAAETMLRHYEAASPGRRTEGWPRKAGDANAANGPALGTLRYHARDLYRNNAWARKGTRAVANHTVGWGIVGKAKGDPDRDPDVKEANRIWTDHFETTDIDFDDRHDIYGLEGLVMETIVQSGECLIRRRRVNTGRGLVLPMQLQVLEPDFIDTTKDGIPGGASNSTIIQGIEFDASGRRIAYWLFEEHPGAAVRRASKGFVSKRVPASEIRHVFRVERPGQVRGVSWFAPCVVTFKDFDEFEDATLLRQKIAACFVAFVLDQDGNGTGMAKPRTGDPLGETMEPGTIIYSGTGRDVKFAQPPSVGEYGPYSRTQLLKMAAGLGISYEALTGDFSQVNFSSARMSRLEMYANIHDYRWKMLVPQMLNGVWKWGMETAFAAGMVSRQPGALWTPPPMAMIEPDKEGLAVQRNIRTGIMTPSGAVREQGLDPKAHFNEYAADLKILDSLGIVLDSDARKTTQAGLSQEAAKGDAAKKEQAEAERPPQKKEE